MEWNPLDEFVQCCCCKEQWTCTLQDMYYNSSTCDDGVCANCLLGNERPSPVMKTEAEFAALRQEGYSFDYWESDVQTKSLVIEILNQ